MYVSTTERSPEEAIASLSELAPSGGRHSALTPSGSGPLVSVLVQGGEFTATLRRRVGFLLPVARGHVVPSGAGASIRLSVSWGPLPSWFPDASFPTSLALGALLAWLNAPMPVVFLLPAIAASIIFNFRWSLGKLLAGLAAATECGPFRKSAA